MLKSEMVKSFKLRASLKINIILKKNSRDLPLKDFTRTALRSCGTAVKWVTIAAMPFTWYDCNAGPCRAYKGKLFGHIYFTNANYLKSRHNRYSWDSIDEPLCLNM